MNMRVSSTMLSKEYRKKTGTRVGRQIPPGVQSGQVIADGTRSMADANTLMSIVGWYPISCGIRTKLNLIN